jgi:hypothetical protein
MSKETYSELEKRRVLALLGEGRDLMEMVSAKIYTTTKDGSTWLYSDLEGFLCYVIDYVEKSQYFILYDFNTFEKLLQFELYNDFSKYYHELSPIFNCFETVSGFMGLKFFAENEAKIFANRVLKFDCKAVYLLFKKTNVNRRKDKLRRGRENVLQVKDKFISENTVESDIISEDFQLNEQGIEILKPSYFEIFNNFTYDKEKKVFKVNKINSEMKNIFKLVGIKKSHFKNETLGLNIFKFFVLCYGQLQIIKQTKTKNVCKLDSNRISIRNHGNFNEIDSFIQRNSYCFVFEKEPEANKISSLASTPSITSVPKIPNPPILPVQKVPIAPKMPAVPKVPSVPAVPKVPSVPAVPKVPSVPAVPKVPSVPAVPKCPPIQKSASQVIDSPSKNSEDSSISAPDEFIIDLSKIKLKPINTDSRVSNASDDNPKKSITSTTSNTVGSFLDEIRKGVQLKKIDHSAILEEKRPVKINKEDKNFLQSALQQAIQQRRMELTKNDIQETESDSDWSD